MTIFQIQEVDSGQQLTLSSGGKVLVSWGSSGSGKSVLATNLAFEFSSLGRRVLLIDADTYSPSISAALGITNPGPGILAALRLARQGRLDLAEFHRLTQELSFEKHTLRLLPGVSAHMRWTDFEDEAVDHLLQRAREFFDLIVVDVSAPLEPGIYAPQSSVSRNQATARVIEQADLVLGTFASDPVGVNRFLWDIRLVGFDYWPIANRVRSQVLGLSPERQLKDAIYKLANKDLRYLLPEDSAATDSALHKAQPLMLVSRNSKLREAIRRLAIDVLEASTKLPNREH